MTNKNDTHPLVMTDRDGTLIKDVPYLSRLSDVEFLPGVIDAIRRLNDLRIPVCVITNQSGVARGYFSEEFVQETHRYMNALLSREGASIDRFFYCPHLARANDARYDVDCLCRKPNPGLLLSALESFSAHPSRSIMVGDAIRDVEAARSAGVKGYLIAGKESPQNPGSGETSYTEVVSFPEAVDRFLLDLGIIKF